MYKPKVIKGIPKETGWPIDGCELYFSSWDGDTDNYKLFGWPDEHDEAVMLTMWQTENEAGLALDDTLDDFRKRWNAGEWEPQGSFCLPIKNVDVIEMKQGETT